MIDHINQDKKDNRIENLRLATRSQNNRNSSGIKGVYWHDKARKWMVQTTDKLGRTIYAGLFNDKQAANQRFNEIRSEVCGEFTPI